MMIFDTKLATHLRLTLIFNNTVKWLQPGRPPISRHRPIEYGLTEILRPFSAPTPGGTDRLVQGISKAISL